MHPHHLHRRKAFRSSGPPTATLRAWWKADAIVGLSDGDALTTWEDSHTHNIDLTQATSSAKPTYKTGQINGLPAIRFDPSVTGRFLAPTASCVGAFTEGEIFGIVKISADPPGSSTNTGLWQWGGTGERMHYPWNGDSAIYDNFLTSLRVGMGNPTPSLASWRLYNVSVAASGSNNWLARLDGAQIANANRTVAVSGNEFLGKSRQVTTTDYWLDGWIAEVLIYSTALSAADRDLVESYLASKYGLTIA